MSASSDDRQSRGWRRRYSPNRGLPFDADELERRILWIWGTPRSGSTWLLRQLCAPARLNGTLPMGFRAGGPSSGPLPAIPFNEFFISHHLVPTAGDPVEVGDELLPQTTNTYMSELPSYAFSEDFAEIWRPEFRRMTLVRLAAVVDRAREAQIPVTRDPLLVIKEVNGTHAAPELMSLFPNSRMLILARDGRDVVDSLADAAGPDGWMTQGDPSYEGEDQRLSFVRRASTEWASLVDVAERARQGHPPDLTRRLRYEDLLSDPEAEIGELRRWLGLPADPELVAAIVAEHAFENLPAERRGPTLHARSAQPGLWRENLSDAEQTAAAEIMGDRLARLGYGE